MASTEDCLRGAFSLPALATPRAKKKKKMDGREAEEGFPEGRCHADHSERNISAKKNNSRFRNFMQSSVKEAACFSGLHRPCRAQEAPQKQGLEIKDDPLNAVSEMTEKKSRQIHRTHRRPRHGNNVSLISGQTLTDSACGAIAFVTSLKACTKPNDLERGISIHKQINKAGLAQTNVFVGSSLVSMYARCGAMEKAQETFDMLPNPNVVSWNALLAGYAQNGHGKKALNCFEQMQLKGLVVDAVTFTCALKACGSVKDLEKGQEIHTQIMQKRFLERDIVVANAVVDMYAKCGALQKAQEVFDHLPVRDIVSWTTLIVGYVQQGHGEEALRCYEQMLLGGFYPDSVTFASILKACGSIRALYKGEEIHAQVKREHLLDKDVVIGNALVDMYIKCGALDRAQKVFDELHVRNLVSWNGLIAGYTQYGHGEEALNCFEAMQREGFFPDVVTFTSALKACGTIGALEKGEKLHLEVVKRHLLEKDIVVAGALVDMYAKCGKLEKARKVFDELPMRDIVTWTSLIAGYVENGLSEEALECFEQMKLDGLSPNAITYACVLKACGKEKALDKGEDIHAQITKRHDGLEKDTVVGTALVDMYSKCGALEKAQEIFDHLSLLDVASWNALILGHAEHGLGNEALNYFQQMQHEGFHPDAATFMCLLRACGSMGAADMGLKVHSLLVKLGLVDKVELFGTLLVVMYSNCGMLLEAEEVFRELRVRDVVSWSVLMEGYAQIGRDENVCNLLKEMKQEGIVPTPVTLTIVLNACSHRGLVEEGQYCFEVLSKSYDILPNLEHHSCMVDLFGRAGHLDTAIALIEKMSLPADLAMWHTLLSACRNSMNKAIGKLAFQQSLHLNEIDDAAYVSMGNIYAASIGRMIQTY